MDQEVIAIKMWNYERQTEEKEEKGRTIFYALSKYRSILYV